MEKELEALDNLSSLAYEGVQSYEGWVKYGVNKEQAEKIFDDSRDVLSGVLNTLNLVKDKVLPLVKIRKDEIDETTTVYYIEDNEGNVTREITKKEYDLLMSVFYPEENK